MNRLCNLILAICGMSAVHVYANSTSFPLEGIWYDNQLMAYYFSPGGLANRKWAKWNQWDKAHYVLDKDELTIRFFAHNRPTELTPEILKGRVNGDRIDLVESGEGQDRPITLHRAPSCEGESTACGIGVYCSLSETDVKYWRIPSADAGWKVSGVAKEAQDFIPYFACAVHLKFRDLYLSHIAFPLEQRALDGENIDVEQTTTETFDAETLERDVKTANYLIYQPTLFDGRVTVYIEDDRSEKEWTFAKQQGAWTLIRTDRAAVSSETEIKGQLPAVQRYIDHEGSRRGLSLGAVGRLPWFQLKHCSPPALAELEKKRTDTRNGEDFEVLVVRFYCALKQGNEDWYRPRFRFPVPYVVRHSEGEERGSFSASDDFVWRIANVDGGEVPLTYSADANQATAHMGSGGGTSNTWMFERIGGKWYLVALDIGDY